MTDQRFEDWWARSPARVALSPAAKEVARGVWQAARDDLVGAPQDEPTDEQISQWRTAFEADAEPMGFDLCRSVCNPNSEPWDDYDDENTGHRWAGWLAAACSVGSVKGTPC